VVPHARLVCKNFTKNHFLTLKNLISFDIIKNNQSDYFLELVTRMDEASLEWVLRTRDWFAFNFSLFSSLATLFITL